MRAQGDTRHGTLLRESDERGRGKIKKFEAAENRHFMRVFSANMPLFL